ncbi:5,10-methylenetetrahydromethanopterin reductase [Embleya sp. AB8]
MRLSVTLSGFEPAADTDSLVQEAAKNGLHGVWCAEHIGFADGITQAARCLTSTPNLTVGVVGLTPYSRHPGITAMHLSTLDQLAPGRLRVAVATGVPDLLASIGLRARQPLASIGAFTTTLRAALAGETVTGDHPGWSFDEFSLKTPGMPHPPPIDICAIQPRMLELAARLGDGVSLSAGASRRYLTQTVRRLESHLRTLGRPRHSFHICAIVAVSIADDLTTAHERILPYLSTLPPDIARALSAGVIAPDRWDRLAEPDPETGRRLAEHAFLGTPHDIPRLVHDYAQTGIDELALCWLSPQQGQDRVIHDAARALAEH